MVTKTTAGNLLTFQAQAGDQIFYNADSDELTTSPGGTISFAPSATLASTSATTPIVSNNQVIIGEITCSADGIWSGHGDGSDTGKAST
jgi:hypothetical protein